jgi:hypothetical protein
VFACHLLLLLLLLSLLQFFAPYASIGGLEMPAAVYLLDFHKSGEDVRNYLSLIGPVLSSRDNIKVCCEEGEGEQDQAG